MSKVFAILLDFVRNKLRGKTRAEYAIGEIIPHRQEMIAKVGILTQIFKLLELIHSRIPLDMGPKEVLIILEIDSFEFGGLDNLLEVLIRTIHISVIKNVVSASQCVQNMDVLQKFSYVEGCTSLLIEIFKDKRFELNKKEIHVELLYKRVYELEKFEDSIAYFTERVKKHREFNLLMILRKMCIIDGNPLPLVQDEIFKVLYQSQDFATRYTLEDDEISSLWVNDNFGQKKKSIVMSDFMDHEQEIVSTEERVFLLEQLTLESDLCYGRNETCKTYFRKIYP